jgi:starch phosphorylase
MAYLAIRGCSAVNGVSRMHGKVSRHLFQPLFPRWPEDEVPVGHITNGIHVPTWDSAEADDLWMETCGKERWMGSLESLEHCIRRVTDSRLWQLRTEAGKSLVAYVRERWSRQLATSGASAEAIEEAKHVFDQDVLILGFARRFATYKRPNLLLHDPERLLRLLKHPQRRAQLIIAGKAHPADAAGQAMIQEWMNFIRRPEARGRVVFLSDYDMLLTERLVQGVDVWINTPRRPWEASGTSGMKVLVNGGLNLSELDGWWMEAYTPAVGWAIGDGREHGDDPAWDAFEAEALYEILEHEVIPEFYARGANGIPTAWVARMRESMARLTPRFSANRSVREYVERHYIPAAAAYRGRAADRGALGKRLVDWRRTLDQKWPGLRFGEATVQTNAKHHVFSVQLHLNALDPDMLRVELYADGVNGGAPERHPMPRVELSPSDADACLFRARVPAKRPPADYTARAMPSCPGAAVPVDAAHILWQR